MKQKISERFQALVVLAVLFLIMAFLFTSCKQSDPKDINVNQTVTVEDNQNGEEPGNENVVMPQMTSAYVQSTVIQLKKNDDAGTQLIVGVSNPGNVANAIINCELPDKNGVVVPAERVVLQQNAEYDETFYLTFYWAMFQPTPRIGDYRETSVILTLSYQGEVLQTKRISIYIFFIETPGGTLIYVLDIPYCPHCELLRRFSSSSLL